MLEASRPLMLRRRHLNINKLYRSVFGNDRRTVTSKIAADESRGGRRNM